jgi:hypothetical protein
LLKDQATEAEALWEQALATINGKHFDTLVNYNLYRWKTALIDDAELKQVLEEDVFTNKHKGHSLEGIIKIALGDTKDGLQILADYTSEQKRLANGANDPSENLRRKRARKHAEEIAGEVALNKKDYFQNLDVPTAHEERIDHIQFTASGRHFTTASEDRVVVWQLEPEIKLLLQFPVGEVELPAEDHRVLAAMDSECFRLAVYEREPFRLRVHKLDLQGADSDQEDEEQWDDVDVPELYHERHRDQKGYLDLGADDFLEDIRFVNDGSELRLYFTLGEELHRTLDISVHENYAVSELTPAQFAGDRGIFKYGARFASHHDAFESFLRM